MSFIKVVDCNLNRICQSPFTFIHNTEIRCLNCVGEDVYAPACVCTVDTTVQDIMW